MPSVNRCSVTTQPMDQRMLEELAQITGQSISAVASRAISEWLLEHYEDRKRFYASAIVMPIPRG